MHSLLPFQNLLQDVVAHKRALDGVRDRAGLLPKSAAASEVLKSIAELEERHDAVAASTRQSIEKFEWIAENISVHQELCTGLSDWQKEMWEKLHLQTGEQRQQLLFVL